MSNSDYGEEGWHLVSGIDEEKQIEKWERSKGQWSGHGKHASSKFNDQSIEALEELGSGTYGLVERISFKAVTMARKHIKLCNRMPIDRIREEANVMEVLSHKHIVKLVGTYTKRRRVRNVEVERDFFLLLYPAATCDLDDFLRDVGTMIAGTCEEKSEAETRLQLLGLKEFGRLGGEKKIPRNSSIDGDTRRPSTAIEFLLRTLGCIAEAVAYVHERGIRHRDLKPKNILLSRGRVFLADFGIARDVRDSDNTQTAGGTGTTLWKAPEVYLGNDHHMSPADVWSLGCIFLAAITAVYGETKEKFQKALRHERDPSRENPRIRKHIHDLQQKATTAWLTNKDEINIDIKHVLELVERMLRHDPKERPTMMQVNISLSELGGLNQTFHLQCCYKDKNHLTEALHKRLHLAHTSNLNSEVQISTLQEEIERYKDRIDSLEKARNTAQTVLELERKHTNNRHESLQQRFNQELTERKKLEERLNSMNQTSFRRSNSHAKGRGRSNGSFRRNESHNGGNFQSKGQWPRQPSKNEEEPTAIQRRPSALPLPVRPSTPLRPHWRQNWSGNNTTSSNSTSKSATPIRPSFWNRNSKQGTGSISSNSSAKYLPTTPNRPPLLQNPGSGNSTLTSSTYSVFSAVKESGSSAASSVTPESPESPSIDTVLPKRTGVSTDSSFFPSNADAKCVVSREESRTLKSEEVVVTSKDLQSPKPSWAKRVAQGSSMG
ncbi:hypothetical protein HYALB_00002744 [Hymenoscyphus albidus]|uniref:Autophagy-related protein 1 n=1 Tax=Hymenoscyphus albidus TaxID=595503 RepID=A0A9N9LKN6_9HELO|nr:hypothetical protein HYALB_00002744 [Hymenoscyphus albidus]